MSEDNHFAYERVAQALATELANSLWCSGDALPSETELAVHFKVSRRTIRKALSTIERTGLITKARGRRTLYRGRAITLSHGVLVDFPTVARRSGFRPSTKVLSVRKVDAGLTEARALDIPLGEPVCEICRLRMLDGKPMVQQRSVLPRVVADQIPAAELERRSLYELLRDYAGAGNLFVASEHFAPSRTSFEEARLSGVDEGRHVVRVTRIVGEKHRMIEYSDSILIGPYFRF